MSEPVTTAATLDAADSAQPRPRIGEAPRPGSLTAAWLGPRPDWLANDVAKALGPFALQPASAPVHGGSQGSADLVHLAGSACRELQAVRRELPDSVLVLDLCDQEPLGMGRRDARRAASADVLLVGARADLREIRRRFPALAPRTALLRRPLDLGRHAPEPALLRTHGPELKRFRRLHRLGPPTVLFAGPFTEAGGLDLAIEAGYALRKGDPELRLAAISTGAIDRRYLDRCERRALGLGHRCIVERSPSSDGLPLWYACATVVSLPYRAPSSAQPARLAAAAGRPTVASEVEPLLDEIAESRTGLLVPAGDLSALTESIGALLDDRGEAARLGAAARAEAERTLSPAVAVEQLLRIWTEAYDRREGRPATSRGRS